MANGIEKAVGILIALGVGVFIINLLLALNYSGYASTHNQLATQYAKLINTNTTSVLSHNAMNITALASNSITLVCSGSCGWISATTPLSVSITGNSVSSFATNTAVATPGVAETQTFSVTSGTGTQTLTSTTGNFFNITQVLLSGMTAGAADTMTIVVTQTYNAVTPSSVPIAYFTNTITANAVTTTYAGEAPGAVANYSNNAGGNANTYGQNINLAIFALIFITIIVAVLLGIKSGKITGEGGFLQ